MRIGGFGHNDPKNISPARRMLQERIKDLEEFCVGSSSKQSGIETIKQEQQSAIDKFREFGEVVKNLMNPNRQKTQRAKSIAPSRPALPAPRIAPKGARLPLSTAPTAPIKPVVSSTPIKPALPAMPIKPALPAATRTTKQAIQTTSTPIALPPAMPIGIPMKTDYPNITIEQVAPRKLDVVSADLIKETRRPLLALPAPKETIDIVEDTVSTASREIKPAKTTFEKIPQFIKKHKILASIAAACIAGFGIFKAIKSRQENKN